MIRAKLNLEQGMVRIKTLVVILIVVLLAVGGWVGYSNYSKGVKASPRYAANHMVSLLADKKADESYDLLSKIYKQNSSKEDWKTWVDIAFDGISGKPKFAREFPIQHAGDIYGKNTTPVRYVYSFTIGNKTYDLPFVFIKEDGAWKLAEIGSPLK